MSDNKAKQFLIRNKGQTIDFNSIKSEVTNLIRDNSEYHLKNIYYEGYSKEDDVSAWFIDLMEYNIPVDLIKLLHNYFGGDCEVTTGFNEGNIRLVFSYGDVEYVQMNYEDNVIE